MKDSECELIFLFAQKLDGFLEEVMSRGLIEDGTVAPDISKVYNICLLSSIIILHLFKKNKTAKIYMGPAGECYRGCCESRCDLQSKGSSLLSDPPIITAMIWVVSMMYPCLWMYCMTWCWT